MPTFLFPCLVTASLTAFTAAAEPAGPVAESWDYAPAMRKVAARFRGKEGVVLHVGDSMTIANPYGQWARSGKGKTPEDEAILRWMHTGANDRTDGWWLCRTEVVHERAYTAVGGMQSTHLLAGGNRGNATVAQMLADFKPRMVILNVGIYDADAQRPVKEYRANMAKAVDQILDHGAICVLSTFAPLHNRLELTKQYNEALRELAKERGVPLIDLETEILTRRPDDWNGTLQRKNNIHLTASEAGGNSGAAPTAENLSKSGYLLRGWLSVRKVAEVKRRVLDEQPAKTEGAKDLAGALASLDGRVIVLGTVREPPLAGMLARDARAGLREANDASRRAWEGIRNRADWERFRERTLEHLRRSLGGMPKAPTSVKRVVTRTLDGDGYQVDNLVFESRPGLVVTANLYRPAKPAKSMPALLLVHSHQQPKNTGARQDMAMTWARAGCVVLVPDHLGHGERRQHPFATAADFPHPFPPRQDYYFRYDAAMHLDLIGDSLMGWMVWDLARGLDVLLTQPGVDAKRVIVVSEPAGGGDVAAVAAALDSRITGAVITNFGGPQPETPYPLPRDAELSFDYAGGGSWESTRNLRNSARDGFLPWTIVAAIAPRRLIYNHEFYWDRDNDPVWKRLQTVYGYYRAADALAGVAGRGFVVGTPPENQHWIAANRELLYPQLERWFDIPNPKKEYSRPRPPEELLCFTPRMTEEWKPAPLHAVAARLAGERLDAARTVRDRLTADERRAALRRDLQRLLGHETVNVGPIVQEVRRDETHPPGVTIERIHLSTASGIVVPVLLLLPEDSKKDKIPVVLGVAQAGKQEFLRQRSAIIAGLLQEGVAVCLPDVRGTGETAPGGGRDRGSAATGISATGLMLAQPLLGRRLHDVQSVLRYLRKRPELDGRRIAVWGDSFAPTNAADADLKAPHGIDARPASSEPAGGLLTVLAALMDDDIRSVYVRGGLGSYRSVLDSPFGYLPHDAVIPGVLGSGDIDDWVAALSPRPVRLEMLVDGGNRLLSARELTVTFSVARKTYHAAHERLQIEDKSLEPTHLVRWFVSGLNKD